MVECDECGSSFESQHGLDVHMGMRHPKVVNRRTCKDCGTEFYSQTEKQFCENCNPYAGKNNGNYKESSGKEETLCEECGVSFSYYPSEKKGLYCSDCQKERPWANRESNIERLHTVDSPAHIGNSRSIDCDWCGESIKRSESEIGENNFCCKQCQNNWLSEEFTGEGHPNWEDDYPTEANYGKGWRRVKIQALERDDYTCQKCGVDKEELGRNPSVHHIKPVETFEDEQDAHTVDNVVSLCPSCHREEEWKIKNGSVRSLEWLPKSILQPS